jgi:hypothetical protein
MGKDNQVDLDELEEALELLADAQTVLRTSSSDPGAIGGVMGATMLASALGPLADHGQTANQISQYYQGRAGRVSQSITASVTTGVTAVVNDLQLTIAAYEGNEAALTGAANRVGSGEPAGGGATPTSGGSGGSDGLGMG